MYVVKGHKDEARRQLQQLRGYSDGSASLQAEIDEMELEAASKVEALGLVQVLRDPQYRLPLIIVCAFLGGQQLSGINAVRMESRTPKLPASSRLSLQIFFYSVSIFRKAGLSIQASQWANLGAGSLNLATSMLGPILLERLNRRPLMLFSTFFCTVFLFLFAMMLYFIVSSVKTKYLSRQYNSYHFRRALAGSLWAALAVFSCTYSSFSSDWVLCPSLSEQVGCSFLKLILNRRHFFSYPQNCLNLLPVQPPCHWVAWYTGSATLSLVWPFPRCRTPLALWSSYPSQ